MVHTLSRHGLARSIASVPATGRLARSARLHTPRRCLSTSPAAEDSAKPSPGDEHSQSKTIFSGIQPTGVPHLGNYLGALQQWVTLQNSSPPSTQLFFSIVDLHSLTARQDPSSRRQAKRDMLAALLAVGIDPKRSTIFYQSAVPAHSELHWILSCEASVGWLTRMTQWKSKLTEGGPVAIDASPLESTPANPNSTARLKLGLFSYPILQAADILLYRATHVPVGEDQAQHIELARDCAAAFNHAYPSTSPLLLPPTTLLSPARRVMSLADPSRKMSKSAPLVRSRVLLSDSPEAVRSKIGAALTDSAPGDITYDPKGRPGVANLLEIMAHLGGADGAGPAEVARECAGLSLKAFKERVAEVVNARLEPIRGEYERLLGEKGGKALDDVALRGAERAKGTAERTMRRVKRAVGID